jgi:colicin import membrane protein
VEFTQQKSSWIRIAQAAALVGLCVAINARAQDKPSPESASAAASAPVADAARTSAPAAVPAPTPAPAPIVEPDPDSVVARYPSGSIQTVDVANKALQDVETQRNALDKKYAAEQHDCYTKFFATSCVDAAKERHRVGTEKVHKVEVEANAFIRGDRVVQRDKRLAEKRANESANPPKPLADLPIKTAAPQNDAERANDHQQRIADHDAKMKQLQQEQAKDAPQRAANVAAYNKKIQDAQARQADVAKKKEEKAKQAAAKAAASNTSGTTTSKIGVVPGASAPDSTSSTPASSAPAPKQ